MERQVFEDFATEIIDLETRKKELGNDIKTAIENFAATHDINKKAVKVSIKAYKEWLKDQAGFYEVDREAAQIINDVMYPGDEEETVDETTEEENEENN